MEKASYLFWGRAGPGTGRGAGGEAARTGPWHGPEARSSGYRGGPCGGDAHGPDGRRHGLAVRPDHCPPPGLGAVVMRWPDLAAPDRHIDEQPAIYALDLWKWLHGAKFHEFRSSWKRPSAMSRARSKGSDFRRAASCRVPFVPFSGFLAAARVGVFVPRHPVTLGF